MSIMIVPTIGLLGSLLLLAGALLKKIHPASRRLLAAVAGISGFCYGSLAIICRLTEASLSLRSKWVLSHIESFLGGIVVCSLLLIVFAQKWCSAKQGIGVR
jgi:hypothetical protein